ncbi:hypothetical protein [Bdellovibrio sp. HCB-110]|uniref:hypothetical protein n=1 Tax=Bdellovibrio sp. HCB-110 TaxID=3391182 RepID=UPI0039B3C466
MSEHSEVVRDYVELRNYLARSNPQPNMEFEINFKIENGSLLAFNTLSKAKVELARVRPHSVNLYLPYYGVMFEKYAVSLIRYVNSQQNMENSVNAITEIIKLANHHKKSLGLREAYEPEG